MALECHMPQMIEETKMSADSVSQSEKIWGMVELIASTPLGA